MATRPFSLRHAVPPADLGLGRAGGAGGGGGAVGARGGTAPTCTPSQTPAPEERGVWPSLGRSVCVEGWPSVPGPSPAVLWPLPLPG